MLDLKIVQSKGRPRSMSCSQGWRKQCALCYVKGHTRVTCPLTPRKHSTHGMTPGEGSSRGKKQIQKTSLSEQGMSLGQDLNYASLIDLFGDTIMVSCATFSILVLNICFSFFIILLFVFHL